MSEAVLEFHESYNFRSRRNRVGGLILIPSVVAFLFGAVASRVGSAQATSQGNTQTTTANCETQDSSVWSSNAQSFDPNSDCQMPAISNSPAPITATSGDCQTPGASSQSVQVPAQSGDCQTPVTSDDNSQTSLQSANGCQVPIEEGENAENPDSSGDRQPPNVAGGNGQFPPQNSQCNSSGILNGNEQASSQLPRPSDGIDCETPTGLSSSNSVPTQVRPLRRPNSAHAQRRVPCTNTHRDEPEHIQYPNPYGNLLSLHDLYTQIPSSGGRLRRFGSDAFTVGTRNNNEPTMDLPVGSEYVLGPGDHLIVNLWGGHSGRLSLTIDRQGQIALPEVGAIAVDGLSIGQAQSAIQKALDTQFHEEHVEISLGRVRTVRVYVVGDVQRPGAYDVSSLSTALSALYAAGGPTSHGSLRILRQYRGGALVREFDLYDFLLRGVRSGIDRLLPGDTLLVPPVGSQITVEGMVHRPAIYELNGEKGLNEVLDLAGGLLASASLKQIEVERIEAHQRRTMFSLRLPDNPEGISQKLSEFKVQDQDDVVISQILPYNEQAVFLQGHVFRPGKYPYRDGMTINDLLHSYQDVMPEPAERAEIVRLEPPDFRPQTIIFNLPDVLIGNDPISLQPFDLIHIFGRYETDSPRVSIEGEVLRPGVYPMSKQMTLADLVRMAGGFKRSAYQTEADLSSYVVQDGRKVEVSHSTVAIQKALEGDKVEDVPLKPGDVVSIRKLAGWQDIGSSVTIDGEVEHAGSYGIEPGEHLSSVLRRAGGFRQNAYPAAAVLERIQVRELAEQSRQDMIRRIETTPVNFKSGALSPQSVSDMQTSLQQQRQQVLASLRAHRASGRLVINISSEIGKWENTPADIELRAGDTLLIPKRPNFVLVAGQVYNPTAISYMPAKNLEWYLQKAGGATPSGNRKGVYVLHADGSIAIAHGNRWLSGDFLSIRIHPGDSVIVPEKIIGASPVWQSLMAVAQIMSTATLPLAIGGVF